MNGVNQSHCNCSICNLCNLGMRHIISTQVGGRGFSAVAAAIQAHPHLRVLRLLRVELDGGWVMLLGR